MDKDYKYTSTDLLICLTLWYLQTLLITKTSKDTIENLPKTKILSSSTHWLMIV
jgi:hypothetical protein